MKKSMYTSYKVAISWIFHSEPEEAVKQVFDLDDETYEFLSSIAAMMHTIAEGKGSYNKEWYGKDWYDVIYEWSVKDYE